MSKHENPAQSALHPQPPQPILDCPGDVIHLDALPPDQIRNGTGQLLNAVIGSHNLKVRYVKSSAFGSYGLVAPNPNSPVAIDIVIAFDTSYDRVLDIGLHPQLDLIAIASGCDKEITFWWFHSTEFSVIDHYPGCIKALAWSSEGDYLAVDEGNGVIKVSEFDETH
jgi:WD40 repeat protein